MGDVMRFAQPGASRPLLFPGGFVLTPRLPNLCAFSFRIAELCGTHFCIRKGASSHGTAQETPASAEHRDPHRPHQTHLCRLREGWAYDDIAAEERLSAERVRQIVSQVLENRVLDRGDDLAHMQIERLRPALRIVGKAVAQGDLKAVGPLIKLVDRIDKHQRVLVKPFAYTEDHRKKLLDKLNWIAANLAADEEDPVLKSEPGESVAEEAACPETAGPEDFFPPRSRP